MKLISSADLLTPNPRVVREVTREAVWTVSSCKSGYGVQQLVDGDGSTYWQSDGPQPHLVNIQFRRKTTISAVAIFVDFKLDESYTPTRISVRAGSNISDLRELKQFEFPPEPYGWQILKMEETGKPLRAFMIQIGILQNHQNGRDTHIRQMRVYSPTKKEENTRVQTTVNDIQTLHAPDIFTSSDLKQHMTIR